MATTLVAILMAGRGRDAATLPVVTGIHCILGLTWGDYMLGKPPRGMACMILTETGNSTYCGLDRRFAFPRGGGSPVGVDPEQGSRASQRRNHKNTRGPCNRKNLPRAQKCPRSPTRTNPTTCSPARDPQHSFLRNYQLTWMTPAVPFTTLLRIYI